MDTYRLIPGSTRLLVSIPHSGTFVPPEIAVRMTGGARTLPDTDWHVDRLYDFLGDMGASVLIATHSRYVADLNRPADNSPLYPGQTETGVCPTETFDGEPIWRPQQTPTLDEVPERIRRYWRPYHDKLRAELDQLRGRHGSAVLWDAHSIKSRVPRLFAGDLPVLNIGTNDGRSCDAEVAARLLAYAAAVPKCTAVLNGRFKGGYITRNYGAPAGGINAIQLELAQCSYMDEKSGEYLPERARQIGASLKALMEIAAA